MEVAVLAVVGSCCWVAAPIGPPPGPGAGTTAGAVITLTVDGAGDADVDYVAVEDVALSFTATHSAAGDITFDSLATGT